MQTVSPAITQVRACITPFIMDHVTTKNGQYVSEKVTVPGPFLLGGPFSFTELELRGKRGWCDIEGVNYAGWTLDEKYFVTYDGTRQLVLTLSEVDNFTYPHPDWADRQQHEHLDAVIQFKRSIKFPRFSMEKGERWGFALSHHWKNSANRDRLRAIECGERFDFAGGQCLAEDVSVIYIGRGDRGYSIACGYIKKPD